MVFALRSAHLTPSRSGAPWWPRTGITSSPHAEAIALYSIP